MNVFNELGGDLRCKPENISCESMCGCPYHHNYCTVLRFTLVSQARLTSVACKTRFTLCVHYILPKTAMLQLYHPHIRQWLHQVQFYWPSRFYKQSSPIFWHQVGCFWQGRFCRQTWHIKPILSRIESVFFNWVKFVDSRVECAWLPRLDFGTDTSQLVDWLHMYW